jgi:hypothetical protein
MASLLEILSIGQFAEDGQELIGHAVRAHIAALEKRMKDASADLAVSELSESAACWPPSLMMRTSRLPM